MKVSPLLLAEIYGNLQHGEIQGIATQIGALRTKVNRELTTMKNEYDEEIIKAAIVRLESRGVNLLHKESISA